MIKQKGFTLIELLIVIAIIAIIAAVVFIALDPLTRFQDARDSSRWSDVSAVLSAVKIDQIDNGGTYVAAISGVDNGTYQIGTAGSGCDSGCTATTTAAACVDLTALVTEGYMGDVPVDPSTGASTETGYYLYKSGTGIVTVGACVPEGDSAISISK